jgi:gamma-glutamyltranspeptidase/glutathione hydrolase
MKKPLALLTPLVLFGDLASGQTPPPLTMRAPMNAKRYAIAAGRHFAVEAGMQVFRAGGNAFDAGAAAVLAASVSEIQLFGFGGEAPMIVYEAKTGKVHVLSGQGLSPAAATRDQWAGKAYIEYSGPRAATVPAVLDSVCVLLSRFGTKRLSEVIAPAIDLADGFPMYDVLHRALVRERKNCERYPSTMAVYYPQGRAPEIGELFVQKDLARTLRAIRSAEEAEFDKSHDRLKAIEAGRDAFYKGDIAHRLVKGTREAGGLLSEEDLAGFRGHLEEPLSTEYRGYRILKAGFWTQGPVMLETLNLLKGFDLKSMGHDSADYVHTVTEAMKLAFDDRDAYYGDPNFTKVPGDRLLSQSYADERRKLIDPKSASRTHRPGGLPETYPQASTEGGERHGGDTTAVNAVDSSGNLLAAVISGAWVLDGAFIAGDTGVPLSQRMQQFSLDEKSPNVVAPKKRPRITLTPTLVLKDEKPYLAISTPGGDTQDQQNLNVLLAHLDFGLPIQEAIEAPRFNSEHMRSSFGTHEEHPALLLIEDTFSPEVLKGLKERGHELHVLGRFRMPTAVTAVGIDPKTGTLFGGADVRGERAIGGW